MKPNEAADLSADNINEQDAENLSRPELNPLTIDENKTSERYSKDDLPAPFYDELHYANYE